MKQDFHHETQVPTPLESPYCHEYVPRYRSASLSQQGSSYYISALPSPPSPTSFTQQSWKVTQEFSPPSLSPLNLTFPLLENVSMSSESDIVSPHIGQESPSEVPSKIRKTRVTKSAQALKI